VIRTGQRSNAGSGTATDQQPGQGVLCALSSGRRRNTGNVISLDRYVASPLFEGQQLIRCSDKPSIVPLHVGFDDLDFLTGAEAIQVRPCSTLLGGERIGNS